MSAQCLPVEVLSSYLDDELARDESRKVEDHLASCPGCRAQLDSLRRVVENLRRLERGAPPPTLAQHVQRRVALDRRRSTPLGRFEAEIQRLRPQLSVFFPFAVVFALAAILLLFTDRLDKDQNRGPVVVIPPPEAAAAFEDPDEELRRKSAAEAGEDAGPHRLEVYREAGGRAFERAGNSWHQVDLLPTAPRREVAVESPAGDELLAEHPWLRELFADGTRVAFVAGDETIVLVSGGESVAE